MTGIAIYVYLYLHIAVCVSSIIHHQFKTHKNLKSTLQPFQAIRNVTSRTKCVVMCTETDFCVSVNYDKEACTMFDRVDLSNLVSSFGYVYMYDGMYFFNDIIIQFHFLY